MAKSKRFQSGREIFHEYIPDFVSDDADDDDVSSQNDKVVEAILSDFATTVERVTSRRESQNA